jgi:hypothetical protein
MKEVCQIFISDRTYILLSMIMRFDINPFLSMNLMDFYYCDIRSNKKTMHVRIFWG